MSKVEESSHLIEVTAAPSSALAYPRSGVVGPLGPLAEGEGLGLAPATPERPVVKVRERVATAKARVRRERGMKSLSVETINNRKLPKRRHVRTVGPCTC
jgi:hypothetical protein